MKERDGNPVDELLAGKAKQLFDESVEGLGGQTRSRLNQGRQAALAELDSGRSRWMHWAPAAGLTAAAAATFVLWTGNPQIDVLATPEVTSDMEILLTEDSLEMIEDLEFYSWIEFDSETGKVQELTNNVG